MVVQDLPDYHEYVQPVNIELPPIEIPELPTGEVIPLPKGGILKKGSVTTTNTYQTIASHVVTSAKTFKLTKILISCDQDVMYQLRWAGTGISAEVLVMAKIPFTDWFPYAYYDMLGDGLKVVDIRVKYPSGGSAGICNVELVGQEVE